MSDLLVMEKMDSVIETLKRRVTDFSSNTVGLSRLSVQAGNASYATSLQREDNWVLVECVLASSPGDSLEHNRMSQWLRWNGHLGGGIKFVLDRKTDTLLLTAEIPLDEEADLLEPAVDQACAGLQQGLQAFADTACKNGNAPTGVGDGVRSELIDQPDASANVDLELLCQELGWPVSRRGDGRCAVELELQDAFCEAVVEPTESGMFRAMAQVADKTTDDELSQRATDILLLSAGRLVRMARPVVISLGDSWAYAWEVVLRAQASPSVWHDAFSALSIACDLSVREIQTFFHDSPIAEYYLRFRESAL